MAGVVHDPGVPKHPPSGFASIAELRMRSLSARSQTNRIRIELAASIRELKKTFEESRDLCESPRFVAPFRAPWVMVELEIKRAAHTPPAVRTKFAEPRS